MVSVLEPFLGPKISGYLYANPMAFEGAVFVGIMTLAALLFVKIGDSGAWGSDGDGGGDCD